jgi:hypothetical protein
MLILEFKAQVSARTTLGRSTPLHLAATNGHRAICFFILNESSKMVHPADVNVRDHAESTPLHLAGSKNTARVLIEWGADVWAKDCHGNDPIQAISERFVASESEKDGDAFKVDAYGNNDDARIEILAEQTRIRQCESEATLEDRRVKLHMRKAKDEASEAEEAQKNKEHFHKKMKAKYQKWRTEDSNERNQQAQLDDKPAK